MRQPQVRVSRLGAEPVGPQAADRKDALCPVVAVTSRTNPPSTLMACAQGQRLVGSSTPHLNRSRAFSPSASSTADRPSPPQQWLLRLNLSLQPGLDFADGVGGRQAHGTAV